MRRFGQLFNGINNGMAKIKTSRLFLSRFLGRVFIALVILVACGENPLSTRPLSPANKKDPYGFWVHQYPVWVKFDRNCREIYRLQLDPDSLFRQINPTTGEIWATGREGNLFILDSDGRNRRLAGTYPYHGGYEFDTNAQVVWVFDTDGFIKKLDYKGKMVKTNVAPRHINTIKVYEKTGDVWAIDHYSTCSPTRLYKFDSKGELLFSKGPKDLGFWGDTYFSDMSIDQTDGGIWLNTTGTGSGYNLFKFDANAKKTATPALRGKIQYIDNKTGDLLISMSDFFYAYMSMYESSGTLLWYVYNRYEMGDSAFISEADGSAIFTERKTRRSGLTLAKVAHDGEWVIRDVPLKREGWLRFRRKPYPY
jgi:hypothetical protein